MSTSTDHSAFPLKRHFYRRIVPMLVAFVVTLVVVSSLSARDVMKTIYLEQAQQRAGLVADGLHEHAPDAWAALLDNKLGDDIATSKNGRKLSTAIAREIESLGIVRIKVYDVSGRTLYSTEPGAVIGKLETQGEALRTAILDLKPALDVQNEPDGSTLYEVYVPIMDATGDLLAIFELYEKPEALNTLLGNAMITAALPSALLFAILVIGLFWMVSRAQADLNRHNARLRQLQDQLSSLVSDSAVAAAQQAGEGGELPVQRRVETIFYSDIRDFTSYSEANSPENVIGFLNEIMEIQIGAIRDAGGDVDKLIGDAVLARFDGSDAERLAMETASLIHQRISDADLPRRVGIGIFTGEVIAGAVGSAARHDYTVIGDTVNVAARLCTEAGTEETVVDLGTARRSQMEDLGDESKITVKGRDEPLVIYRRR